MDTSLLKVQLSGAPSIDFFDTSWNSWFDLSAYVQNIDFHRGRSKLLDSFTAGTCNIALDNRDRQFEPNNTDSAFFPNIQIRRGIRIFLDYGTSIQPLFAGYVDGWDFSYDSDGQSIATIRAFDVIGRIAAADLGTLKFGKQLSGSRVAGVLQAPGLELDLNESAWYKNDYAIGASNPLLFQTDIIAGEFYTREGTASSSALNDIYRCALVENAEFFAKASGALAYRKLDWTNTTDLDVYNKYEWNFCRNTRGTIDALYYTKGTRDSSILTTTGIKSVTGHKATGDPDVPIIIYDDDAAPGIDICRKLYLGFWATASSSTSGNSFTAHLELYNDLGITKTFSQTFDVASSSAWTQCMMDVGEITPGATGIRFWVTNDANNVSFFWLSRVGFYYPVSNINFWDGSTTDTATENYGWDTGTRKANIKKSRHQAGIITFKANNAFDDIYYVYLYADKASSTYDIKDSLEITSPTSFTVDNNSTITFTGGYAKIIPYGTSFRSTKTTRDISYNTAEFDDAGNSNPYINIELSYGTEEFYNQVKVTTDGDTYEQKDTISDHVFTKTGNVTIAQNNQDSIKTYGVFGYNIGDALTSDKQGSLELAERILASHDNPEYRVESVTVRAAALDQIPFGLEIWDLANVTFTPNQVGSTITAEMYVIGIDAEINNEYADVTFRLATKSPIAPPSGLYPVTWISQSGVYSNVAITSDASHYYTMSMTTSSSPYATYLQKWNSNDTLVWQKSLGSVSTDTTHSLVLDKSDNVFIAGKDLSGAKLIKITSAGAIAWQKSFTVDGRIWNIDTDDAGNSYVAFVVGNPSSNNKMVINKFNSSGTVVWSKETTIAAKYQSTSLAVSPSGNYIYVAADVKTYGALHCYSSSGSLLWSKKFNASGFSFGFNCNVKTVDESGVWLWATAPSVLYSLIAKFDSSGSLIYGYSADVIFNAGFHIDADENLYLAGAAESSSGGSTYMSVYSWTKAGIGRFNFELDRKYGAPRSGGSRIMYSNSFDVSKYGFMRSVGGTKYADGSTNAYFPFGTRSSSIVPSSNPVNPEYRWYFNGIECLMTGGMEPINIFDDVYYTFTTYSPGNSTSTQSISAGSISLSTSTLTVHASNQKPVITPW
jgi:hypothetical protein